MKSELNLKTGDIVTLKPISNEANNSIEQQGEKWIVEAIAEKMLFDDKTGVWLGLRSKSKNDLGFKWVHLTNDDNFEVIKN